MQNEEKNQQEILDKLKSGEVAMSPRIFLRSHEIFWIVVVFILISLAAYLASFMLFVASTNRLWDLLFFGPAGIKEFVLFFPWLFVLVVLLLAWLAERFAWRYSFAYRAPKLYVALASLVVTAIVSLVIVNTPFHSELYESAQTQNLPIAGPMYRFFGQYRPGNFYIGKLSRIYPDEFLITSGDGSTVLVKVLSNTRIYGRTARLGDNLDIFTKETANGLDALYIKQISSDSLGF